MFPIVGWFDIIRVADFPSTYLPHGPRMNRTSTICSILVAWIAATGCNRHPLDGVVLLPVVGKVIVNGTPLTRGSLAFRPEKAKGNESTHKPNAAIAEDGTYTVKTADRDGAPAGWYRVTVSSAAPVDPKSPYETHWNHHLKYVGFETTDLFLEVKESGTYNLKLLP